MAIFNMALDIDIADVQKKERDAENFQQDEHPD
jgi:hypothetical protein